MKSTAVGSRKCVKLTLAKRYVRPDGNALWVRNSFYLLRDQSQLPSHIILICNYVTELRRAERLLINNEKFAVVGQLASSIAHEINNHLEAALYLFYLVREADTLEKARNYAAQAEEEVQRGLKLLLRHRSCTSSRQIQQAPGWSSFLNRCSHCSRESSSRRTCRFNLNRLMIPD